MKITFLNKLVLFCLALVVVRFLKTGHYSFIFLFWNLFLGWLPLFFIRRIKANDVLCRKVLFIGLSVLFMPNAPYILTDLFHLKKGLLVPLWFDLVLILSFAFLGMIYFIKTLDQALGHINSAFPRLSVVAKPLLFISTAYGIYLGRYLRFNSWEIVSDPLTLVNSICRSLFDHDHFKETWSVTITFTVFLYLIYEIYLSFKKQNFNPAQ